MWMRGTYLATASFRISAALYLNLPFFFGLPPWAPFRVNLCSGGGAMPSDHVEGGALAMIWLACLRENSLSFTIAIQNVQ